MSVFPNHSTVIIIHISDAALIFMRDVLCVAVMTC